MINRKSDQFSMRLPDGLRDRIKAVAAINRRSMNSEIAVQLDRIYGAKEAAAGGEFGDQAPAASNHADVEASAQSSTRY